MDESSGICFIVASVLYVTYDGLEEPLGQSQVLPYVKGLAEQGHRFELLSFEKPGIQLRFREKLAPNIHWTALRYHRTPTVPATAYDLLQGFIVAMCLILWGRVKLVHVRSYVPCAMVLPLVKMFSLSLLFDTRGLWADEKVDSGSWTQDGWIYKLTKKLERQMFKQTSAIAVLTVSFKSYLQREVSYREEIKARIFVIPTCTDLKLFSPTLNKEDTGDLIYVGSLGGCYMSEEMVRFYAAWRKYAPNPRFILVTKSSVSEIKNDFTEIGAEQELIHLSVKHHEVPGLIQKAQATLCFIRPSFSKIGSAPTKLGELLACGLPVAANIVGDMARILEGSQAGVIVQNMDDEALEEAAKELFERSQKSAVRQEARALAEKWFDLKQAVDVYDGIYREIL